MRFFVFDFYGKTTQNIFFPCYYYYMVTKFDELYKYYYNKNVCWNPFILQKNNAIRVLVARTPSARWSTTCRCAAVCRVTMVRRLPDAAANANPITIVVRLKFANNISALPRAAPALVLPLRFAMSTTTGHRVLVQR